jgi:hypothetical protein
VRLAHQVAPIGIGAHSSRKQGVGHGGFQSV